MTAISSNPSSTDFLSSYGFKLLIKRAPDVNYFVSETAIPSITLPPAEVGNPFVTTPTVGDHLTFAPFNVAFKVSENLADYLEIYNWITALGFPENYGQRRKIEFGNKLQGQGEVSDITLLVLNNNKNAIFEVLFVDAFPIDLGEIQFIVESPEIQYTSCQVSFAYSYFTVKAIGACP